MLVFKALGLSDTGLVRRINEDSFLMCCLPDPSVEGGESLLAIVADGVGGHAQGDRASSECVQMIRKKISGSSFESGSVALRKALLDAHAHLQALIREDETTDTMGTTCTAAWLGNKQAYIAQVGDSRAYILRNSRIVQITEDQTMVQKLLREGLISRSDADKHPEKNLILQALGISEQIEVDVFHVPLQKGDVILLCTDGLHGLLSDTEMAQTISSHCVPDALERLIKTARDRGGHDNITAVILKEGDAEAEQQPLADTRINTRPLREDAPCSGSAKSVQPKRYLKKVLIVLLPLIIGIGTFVFLNFHNLFDQH